jgi:hypothetical protein
MRELFFQELSETFCTFGKRDESMRTWDMKQPHRTRAASQIFHRRHSLKPLKLETFAVNAACMPKHFDRTLKKFPSSLPIRAQFFKIATETQILFSKPIAQHK